MKRPALASLVALTSVVCGCAASSEQPAPTENESGTAEEPLTAVARPPLGNGTGARYGGTTAPAVHIPTAAFLGTRVSIDSFTPTRPRPNQSWSFGWTVQAGTSSTSGRVVALVDGHTVATHDVSLAAAGTASGTMSEYPEAAGAHTLTVRYEEAHQGFSPYPYPHQTTFWSPVDSTSKTIDVVAFNAIAPGFAGQIGFCVDQLDGLKDADTPNMRATLERRLGNALTGIKKKDPAFDTLLATATAQSKCVSQHETFGIWPTNQDDPLWRDDGLNQISLLQGSAPFAFSLSSQFIDDLATALVAAHPRVGTDFKSDPNGPVQIHSATISYGPNAHLRTDIKTTIHLSPGVDPDITFHLDDTISVENYALKCATHLTYDVPTWLEAAMAFLPPVELIVLESVTHSLSFDGTWGVGCQAAKAFPASIPLSSGLAIPFDYTNVSVDARGIFASGGGDSRPLLPYRL